MNIEIRSAGPGDREALVSLSREWNDDQAVAEPSAVERTLAGDGTERIWVAVVGGEIVGFAAVQQTRSFRYRRPTHELTELYVTESHRRRGVGSQLLEAVRVDAESCGALELFLRVHRDNRAARRLYERAGLEAAAHHVYRDRHY